MSQQTYQPIQHYAGETQQTGPYVQNPEFNAQYSASDYDFAQAHGIELGYTQPSVETQSQHEIILNESVAAAQAIIWLRQQSARDGGVEYQANVQPVESTPPSNNMFLSFIDRLMGIS